MKMDDDRGDWEHEVRRDKALDAKWENPGKVYLYHGDCLDVLRGIPSDSVDSVVTDPPYGLSFMGKRWDYDVPSEDIWRECLRVLKPGGHLLAFAGTRTQHRMAVRIEDAGFEIRDMIAWVYGSGFPKSHNLKDDWAGFGTALKPALEPITVARKPFPGTVAANVLAHGTGAINVDGCRVGTSENLNGGGYTPRAQGNAWAETKGMNAAGRCAQQPFEQPAGRWPANLIHDGSDEVLDLFPDSKTTRIEKPCPDPDISGHRWGTMQGNRGARGYDGEGSAARFFYCAKASKRDRDEGCEGLDERKVSTMNGYTRPSEGRTADKNGGPKRNHHPTVKPTDLMRYLCRLVTPPGGVVLDPFMGSGSTGKAAALEGFQFIGIEIERKYFDIACERIEAAQAQHRLFA